MFPSTPVICIYKYIQYIYNVTVDQNKVKHYWEIYGKGYPTFKIFYKFKSKTCGLCLASMGQYFCKFTFPLSTTFCLFVMTHVMCFVMTHHDAATALYYNGGCVLVFCHTVLFECRTKVQYWSHLTKADGHTHPHVCSICTCARHKCTN